MYYSYKTKKKNRKLLKFLTFAAIIVCIYYFGSKYQQYIFFWKYTTNKIHRQLESVSMLTDNTKKAEKLKQILEICSNYNIKNQVLPDCFLLTGRVHYMLGEIYLNKSFTEYIVNECTDCVNENARSEFISAIKFIKKGVALSRSNEITTEYLLLLSKACYYSGYSDISDIYELVKKSDIKQVQSFEDIRFISAINIMNKNEESGLGILERFGMISDSILGRFFLASSYSMAGKYNNSIMCYKEILDNCEDNRLIKLANMNLGKIYFTQSLYRESLLHFTKAHEIDKGDNFLKIWIGKNYSALGNKVKANAIWSEVLATDRTNKEAKQLLGLM